MTATSSRAASTGFFNTFNLGMLGLSLLSRSRLTESLGFESTFYIRVKDVGAFAAVRYLYSFINGSNASSLFVSIQTFSSRPLITVPTNYFFSAVFADGIIGVDAPLRLKMSLAVFGAD